MAHDPPHRDAPFRAHADAPLLEREAARGREGFFRSLRPKTAELLRALGIDVTYERAEGDWLEYRDERGAAARVLDLVGGYGASLFGHNHPALAQRAVDIIRERRPFHAQASVRALAGRLADRLSERVGRTTGRSYIITLAASGAEAVDAALKHAEMERRARLDDARRDLERTIRATRYYAERGELALAGDALEAAQEVLGHPVRSTEELLVAARRRLDALAEEEPLFLTLERGFHGKLIGAQSLTASAGEGDVFGRLELSREVLPVGDEEALERALQSARVRYLELSLVGACLHAQPAEQSRVAAALVEPIQGEGGVREVPADDLRALRRRADACGFPLVFDEIQCGLGRTGDFLGSESAGVRADYYLFSKSLGGGLAKISALLVDAARYQREFGAVHTSTFADDDFSSGVALAALDLLDADDGALLARVTEAGRELRGRLEELCRRYPEQFAEVRGRGLMLGLELAPPRRASSPLMRAIADQELIGAAATAYLHRAHRVRVAPSLSAPSTLRIQPSAYIASAEIERAARALGELAEVMRAGDVSALLTGRPAPARASGGASEASGGASEASGGASATEVGEIPGEPWRISGPSEAPASPPAEGERAAFLAHFLEPGDLRRWDPSLDHLSADECADLIARTSGVLEPFVAAEHLVAAPSGERVSLSVIGLPLTASQVTSAFSMGNTGPIRALVREGFELATARGARVVGCGGYTSIVTGNCVELLDDRALVTSGNSLTAAASWKGALRAAERLELGALHLGVVGAMGNLGMILAELLAPVCARVVLVGRRGAQKRLERRADALRAAARADGPSVEVATEMDALRRCNLIASATNAPEPVVRAEHIADAAPVVVCDVASPGDVAPEVAYRRPRAAVLQSGLVRLPNDQELALGGPAADPRWVYGCLGETLLLGLSGAADSLSVGPLNLQNVRAAADLAERYGFHLDASLAAVRAGDADRDPSERDDAPLRDTL